MSRRRAEYRLSPEAERDLQSIWLYTFGEWGQAQADLYIDRLVACFAEIAAQPQRGQDVGYIRLGYRRRRMGRHGIYYRVTGYGVAVIRILHERMSVSLHLSESGDIE